MDCRIKSGNDAEKKGSRTPASPGRPPLLSAAATGEARPPACRRSTAALARGTHVASGSASGQASWEAVLAGVTRVPYPSPVRTARAGRNAGRLMPDAARQPVYGRPAGPHPLHPQGVPSAEGVLMSGTGFFSSPRGASKRHSAMERHRLDLMRNFYCSLFAARPPQLWQTF